MPFTLPDLPYAYDALEPHIDARTMEIHHTKHHAAYIEKLNAALSSRADLEDQPLAAMLADLNSVPADIRLAVRNHGGGHLNHSFFWPLLSPNGGGEAKGDLAAAIKKNFNGFSDFKEKFTKAATSHFGSGWAWLVVDQRAGLSLITTSNQDSPLSQGLTPILGLDIWEHAYYLKYQNRRPDYIAAWWNVVNWQEVERRYEEAE